MRRIFYVTGAILVLCAVGLSALVMYTRARVHSKAQALVSYMKVLSANPDAFSVDTFKANYGGQIAEIPPCTARDCTYRVELTNSLLSTLHVTPRAMLLADVWVVDGRVRMVHAGYMFVGSRSEVFGVSVSQWTCNPSNPCNPQGRNYRAALRQDGWGQPWDALVDFSSFATQAQRDAAWNLNVDCLTKFGGCKDSREMLPEVWRQDNALSNLK